MKKSIYYGFCFIFLLAFSSCTKEIHGPQGLPGIDGVNGGKILTGKGNPESFMGELGDFYIDFNAGALYGPKKSTGWGTAYAMKGATGNAGSAGDKGANGTNGVDGATLLSGENTPAASLGKNGDFYFDKNNTTLFGPKANNSWGTPVSLISGSRDVITISKVYNVTAELIYQNSWYGTDSYYTNDDFEIQLDAQLVKTHTPLISYKVDEIWYTVGINNSYSEQTGQINDAFNYSYYYGFEMYHRKNSIFISSYLEATHLQSAPLCDKMDPLFFESLKNNISLPIKVSYIPNETIDYLQKNSVAKVTAESLNRFLMIK